MDRQGRLAQTLNSGWLLPGSNLVRAKRFARRWLSTIIELEIPRGVGSAAAFVIIAGSVGYGIAAGGHAADIEAELHRTCDAMASQVGLGPTDRDAHHRNVVVDCCMNGHRSPAAADVE